jgi:alpha-galactosidase
MFARMELACLEGRQKRFYYTREAPPDGISITLENSAQGLQHGQQVLAELRHREPLELLGFKLELLPGLAGSGGMMVNGFQSWSRSEELGAADRIPPLFAPARRILAAYGDYRYHRYSGRPGRLHSWTYTYFRLPGGAVFFIGSVDEKAGYTLFEYDYGRDRLLIEKDCLGAVSAKSYPLLRLYLGWGELEPVLKEYFSLLPLPRRIPPRATGWTSWYNYYTGISEAIVRHNLKELSRRELPLEIFQIDDGWQSALGDWLEGNAKFPAGMPALAMAIREHGFRPGLWLAPFICDRTSRLFQENPQWLLRNRRGKPVKAGFNPNWKGWFYALDFYAPGFQDHLRRVFQTVQEEWGFSMLKLDFLYAAALLPRQGKPRGQVMHEVMEFVHAQTRKSRLLGCGVPLGPAMGRVDYCRIGSDVAPYWEDRFLKALQYRERVSTVNSLAGTIGRRHLDRKAFRNDPDVFMLRDGAGAGAGGNGSRNRLDPEQRYTLFFLNNLLGGLIFFSDNVDGYKDEQLQLLRRSFPSLDAELLALDHDRGLYRIEFMIEKKSYLALCNLTAAPRTLTLEGGPYFHPDLFVLFAGHTVTLEPYRTLCFYRVEPRESKPYLLGSTGHIYPGAQVEKLIIRPQSITLHLHKHASPESKVLLAVPRGVINLQVNKVNYPVTLKNRVHFVTVTGRDAFTGGAV